MTKLAQGLQFPASSLLAGNTMGVQAMAEITPGHPYSRAKTQCLESSFQGITLPRTHLNPRPKLEGQLKS